MKVSFEFKREDLWVGVFWRCKQVLDDTYELRRQLMTEADVRASRKIASIWNCDVWICLVPMFPIHISWVKVYWGIMKQERE